MSLTDTHTRTHPPSANTVQGDMRTDLDPDPACPPPTPAPPCASSRLCLLPAPLWGRDGGGRIVRSHHLRILCRQPFIPATVLQASPYATLQLPPPEHLPAWSIAGEPAEPPAAAPTTASSLAKAGGDTPPERGLGAPIPLLFLQQPSRRRGRWRRCSAKTCFQRFSLGTLQQLCWV